MDSNGVIEFKVINSFGEYSAEVTVDKIDKVDPTIDIDVDGNKVDYYAGDDLSGVRYIYLPNGETVEVDADRQLNETGQFVMEGNGKFEITVEDYAGNRSSVEFNVNREPEDSDDEESIPIIPLEPSTPVDKADQTDANEPSKPWRPGKNDGNHENHGRSNVRDTKEYKDLYKKLITNIPYTILKDSKVAWNKVTGISDKDLSVKVDTSKVGVTTLVATLKGVRNEFKVEVVELLENEDATKNTPKNHWAYRYIIDTIENGYIVGGVNGDLRLNDTLKISDSFTAIDRLLLNKDLVTMISDRNTVESKTSNMKDTWYTYPVKSVLSKYNKEALSKLEIKDFERAITREEMAQVIYNSLKGRVKLTEDMLNYKDMSEVENLEAVEFCTRAGILSGYPDGTIRPKGKLTRVEFMKILSVMNSLDIK
jgi:hypothetical protein